MGAAGVLALVGGGVAGGAVAAVVGGAARENQAGNGEAREKRCAE